MSTRPYRLVGATELAEARQRLHAALQAWAARWLAVPAQAVCLQLATDMASIDTATPGTAAGESGADASARWGHLAGAAEGAFAWADERGVEALARAQWGMAAVAEDGADDLCAALAAQALQELLAALAAALHGAPCPAPGRAPRPLRCGQPGAAVLALAITLGGERLLGAVGLPDAAARTAPGPRAALHPLREALAGQPVSVSVQLAELEVELGQLCHLAPGDVLRLHSRLAEPVQLRIDEAPSAAPLLAYLGAVGPHRAVEIVHAGAAR